MMRGAVTLAGLAVLLCAPGAWAADPQVVTSVSPQPARFGDVIHATVTVRAGAVAQVQPGFAPFQVLRSTSSHTRSGSDVLTTWRYDLQCLDPVCAPGPGARKVIVSSSRVLVAGANVVARFPAVRIDPRTTAKQVANPDRYFLQPTAPVPPTYRVSPSTLRLALLGTSLVLVLAAAGLVLPLARGRSRAAAGDGLDALGSALALVRASLSRPPPDRRRALGLLSRTLRKRGEPQVARAAADLAWSEPEPDPNRMTRLVDRIGGAS